MKTFIASLACVAVFVGYLAVLVGLGVSDETVGAKATLMSRIATMTPLMLLVGAVWSGITGKGFPKTMDPLGLIPKQDEKSSK